MSFSSASRQQLAHLLLEYGPSAPTLCAGWTTRDLAAHLWVRENKLLAAAGMFFTPLSSTLEKEMEKQKARDFATVVQEWAAGPPRLLRVVDGKVNAVEHFVHLEDVRRANGMSTPRDLSEAANDQLYQGVKLFARRLLAESESPVVLYPRGYDRIVAADKRGVTAQGDDVVRVNGAVGEILLWVLGRDEASVSIAGDDEKQGVSKIQRRSL